MLGDQEYTLVTLRLGCVNQECMAVCMDEALLVEGILLEAALCSVAVDGTTCLFLHNPSTSPRRLRKRTYIADH